MPANPLLDWTLYPDFPSITPAHIAPAMDELLDWCEGEVAAIEAVADPSWDTVMRPLEVVMDRLERIWGVVGTLNNVRNSPELREPYAAGQARVVAFSSRVLQSRALYEAYRRIRDEAGESLSQARQRILEAHLRDAELSGVALDADARARFAANSQRLAALATTFSDHVLDVTRAYALRIERAEAVAGLPQNLLELAAAAARERGEEAASAASGPWVITLDAPSFVPFLQHCRDRSLREQVYRAYITRASSGEYGLARKRAGNVAAVDGLLDNLRRAARPAAGRERAALEELAAQSGAPEAGGLQPWDLAFWAERERERRFALSEEELRPYFPLDRALEGLFDLVGRLFGVQIAAAPAGAVPVWHEDVRYYRVHDAESLEEIAGFYLDAFSRPAEKRGGAWMDALVNRSDHLGPEGGARLPVAYINCNQSCPVGETPSLMSFRELETLFHEFGHAAQHMLTAVSESRVAGINGIEWDAVEQPSHFLEKWCYHPPTLRRIARHYRSGEALSEDTLASLLATRTFRTGYATLRQVYFAMLDMELHARFDPAGGRRPIDCQHELARAVLVDPVLSEDRFLCAFRHIFAGGYASGYYSYKWSEVLAADDFAAFLEAGPEDESALAATGRRFRDTVLGLGGSVHPAEVFRRFRGRDPDSRALLVQDGLVSST
ncbi:MAG: M3 family metallopeptidase [Planctomycetota bacterium]